MLLRCSAKSIERGKGISTNTHTRILLLGEHVSTTGQVQECGDVHGYVDELYKVANETHDGEADGNCPADLDVLCEESEGAGEDDARMTRTLGGRFCATSEELLTLSDLPALS